MASASPACVSTRSAETEHARRAQYDPPSTPAAPCCCTVRAFHAVLVGAYGDRDAAQGELLNVKPALRLADHIGSQQVLRAALVAARPNTVGDEPPLRQSVA
jgi:Protein of unknown function (DUF2783)